MEPVIPAVEKQLIGQRLLWSFDVAKTFKHKPEPINGVEGTEIDRQRVYHFALPYGAPFEEVYTVLDELKAELQAIEIKSKEQAAKLAAEKEAKSDAAEIAAN